MEGLSQGVRDAQCEEVLASGAAAAQVVLETWRREARRASKTRAQVIEVPKISCRDSVEMVRKSPQERSSERMCESPDQLWHSIVEQNLDAWVGQDPAARALVLERLRERV